MTVIQLVAELMYLRGQGYGEKEVMVYEQHPEYPEGDTVRPVNSVAYISLRRYARDIVEIV